MERTQQIFWRGPVWIVNIGPIKHWPTSQNNKRSHIEPSSSDNVEEDEDAR